ncbi:MAG: TorF family putative porin [Steroidobacteraceae bacterium]
MIKSRIAVAGALLVTAGLANAAGFTFTPTLTSDYDFRGVSQTNPEQDDDIKPALQLGANYSFESGFYAGIWGSNVDFDTFTPDQKPDIEMDYTVGFAGGDAAKSFGFDFGATYYTYLSASSGNTVEIYAGLSKGWFAGKLWYSDDYFSTDRSGFYLEGNATIPLPKDFSLLAHVGMSDGDYWASSVTDYSIGVGKSFGNFATTLKWVDGTDGLNGRAILSVSTTLPWAE